MDNLSLKEKQIRRLKVSVTSLGPEGRVPEAPTSASVPRVGWALQSRRERLRTRSEGRVGGQGVGTEAKGGTSHPIRWQVSDGLASTCSLEGTETPT